MINSRKKGYGFLQKLPFASKYNVLGFLTLFIAIPAMPLTKIYRSVLYLFWVGWDKSSGTVPIAPPTSEVLELASDISDFFILQ